MGWMNKVKRAVQGRSQKVSKAVDTATDQVDKRTGGKYSDKLQTGADKLKQTARNLDEQSPTRGTGTSAGGGTTSTPADSGTSARP